MHLIKKDTFNSTKPIMQFITLPIQTREEILFFNLLSSEHIRVCFYVAGGYEIRNKNVTNVH